MTWTNVDSKFVTPYGVTWPQWKCYHTTWKWIFLWIIFCVDFVADSVVYISYQCLRAGLPWLHWINTLRLRQNGRHFPDDIFKWIFLNENVWISIDISLKFVPRGPINNIPTLVQVMAWRRPGDKPLSEPMMVRLPTHICVTWPQWVNTLRPRQNECHFADDIFKFISMIVNFDF